MSEGRNTPLGFAANTWKNFEFIEQAAKDHPEYGLHPVTQLALSLLGLIVLQHEKNRTQFNGKIRGMPLDSLNWPNWEMSNPINTLGQLIKQVRHVIAHGGITYSSAHSQNFDDVLLTFYDPDSKWIGKIKAADLRTFCLRFKELLEQQNSN
ncbi:MAG TPA: hypothetical protein VFK06_03325 [Candidatus Angelobacter sp.]|nr:hypothetical protein [Candidatus Angelobacter sp.]